MCNGLPTGIFFEGDTNMNYTKNHHLPQWVESDLLRMEDFNEAMASIESALSYAQTAANAAMVVAKAAAEAQPFLHGSYNGTGEDLDIPLGFRPSFVIINGMTDSSDTESLDKFGAYSCATMGSGTVGNQLEITSDGVILHYNNGRYPRLTSKGHRYELIAFK